MSARRLSEDQKRDIVQAYRDGLAVRVIAKRFSIHHSYPTLLARRRGLETRAKRENSRYEREAAKPAT